MSISLSTKATVNCKDVIKAADNAIAKKDDALKDANKVITIESGIIKDQTAAIQDKDKELSSVGKNGYIMIGTGIATGALLATNLVLPGVGLLVTVVVFTQVLHIF